MASCACWPRRGTLPPPTCGRSALGRRPHHGVEKRSLSTGARGLCASVRGELCDVWYTPVLLPKGWAWDRQTPVFGETVAELPGLASPCTMKCCQGLLTAFGVGFTPHIQRQARTNLRLRPHSVDTLLHLAIAPIAPLHRIRGGGQQLVIKKRQSLFQRGGKEFLQGLPHLWEPLEPTPQCGEFAQSGLGPTAPIEERVHLVHDCSERI